MLTAYLGQNFPAAADYRPVDGGGVRYLGETNAGLSPYEAGPADVVPNKKSLERVAASILLSTSFASLGPCCECVQLWMLTQR